MKIKNNGLEPQTTIVSSHLLSTANDLYERLSGLKMTTEKKNKVSRDLLECNIRTIHL